MSRRTRWGRFTGCRRARRRGGRRFSRSATAGGRAGRGLRISRGWGRLGSTTGRGGSRRWGRGGERDAVYESVGAGGAGAAQRVGEHPVAGGGAGWEDLLLLQRRGGAAGIGGDRLV